MPQQVRAVVVDPAVPGKLAIKPVELRDPDRDEVAVRVTAISLNRGETRRAVASRAGVAARLGFCRRG
jgi:NADPH:quinone reductase